MDKEEIDHFVEVLHNTHIAVMKNDLLTLAKLSNQTLHSASIYQDSGSITIAVLVYTISKIIERKDNLKIKDWDKFVKRFDSFLSLAEKALRDERLDAYEEDLQRARKALTSLSVNIRPYIQEVLRKASVNKASKIYEHGISMEKTSNLLGITQWELADYIGQSIIPDKHLNSNINIRERAKRALEFFS
jgi:hypothetical protein